ncbi:Transcriptional regulator, LysR family [hydrothermal vent metagenome]|uniref:Transcriptional regulator, LysR family n=1 Tax=hydrothermal vent metagenome TaxID=652676 RepID=A0A3B0VFI9_9ZZZZ
MNEFKDMKSFIRIVEAGSITKAASQLNIAKSALSKRLSILEQRLGINLLNRTTRSQALTDSGKLYYQQCLRIIEDVSVMESSLQNKLCALSGPIKITVPLSFGLSHLSPALLKFNKTHPQIQFDIDFNDKKVDLINEGYDMALRIGKLEDSSLIAKKITSAKLILVASESYLKKHGTPQVPTDLLQGHVRLHYRNTTETLTFKNNDNTLVSINIPTTMISNSGDYLCQAAVHDMGLLSTPDFICHKYVKTGQLRPILTDYYQPAVRGIYAVYPQTRHLSRKARELIDFFVKYFAKMPDWGVRPGI